MAIATAQVAETPGETTTMRAAVFHGPNDIRVERVPRPLRLSLEQLRQSGVPRQVVRGVVPLQQNGTPLLRAENLKRADRPLRIGYRRFQQPNRPRRRRR